MHSHKTEWAENNSLPFSFDFLLSAFDIFLVLPYPVTKKANGTLLHLRETVSKATGM